MMKENHTAPYTRCEGGVKPCAGEYYLKWHKEQAESRSVCYHTSDYNNR